MQVLGSSARPENFGKKKDERRLNRDKRNDYQKKKSFVIDTETTEKKEEIESE